MSEENGKKAYGWWVRTIASTLGVLLIIGAAILSLSGAVDHAADVDIHEPPIVKERRIDAALAPVETGVRVNRETGIRNEQRIIAIDQQLTELKDGQAQILRELRNN